MRSLDHFGSCVGKAGEGVVARGGMNMTDEGRSAWLRWGMVSAGYHRRGIGRQLIERRLRWSATQPLVETIRVATTGEASAFFQRMGFDLVQATKDYYGPGMAQHNLELRRELQERPRCPSPPLEQEDENSGVHLRVPGNPDV
ncbi:MAG: GNAT family N-acetyltransferase [Chloroflexota bacterium]|nr:GNAT family N-acetyltransferase [Chloroflexota bacterium]